MNAIRALFVVGLVASSLGLQADQTYREEFKTFKKSPAYRVMFDRNTNRGLSSIRKDLENYKRLNSWHRDLSCAMYLELGVVISSKTMPKLSAYVTSLCQEQSMQVPPVFIMNKKGLFGASSRKLFMGPGAILIGQDLLLELSDEALEAVIAHEIGHIKYNHLNKKVFGLLVTQIVTFLTLRKADYVSDPAVLFATSSTLASLMWCMLAGKYFEKQADEFACSVGRSKGLIQGFEKAQQKDQQMDDDFDAVYEAVTTNSYKIEGGDYLGLMLQYYLAKGGHLLNKGFKWVYYNTPFGAHPSHDARIQAAQEYLAQHAGEMAVEA